MSWVVERVTYQGDKRLNVASRSATTSANMAQHRGYGSCARAQSFDRSTVAWWESAGAGRRDWVPVAPSAVPFDDEFSTPHELNLRDLDEVVDAFVAGASRDLGAGFQCIELHLAPRLFAARIPLALEQSSQKPNTAENRMRFPLRVARALRGRYWPLRAASRLRATVDCPVQYERGRFELYARCGDVVMHEHYSAGV